MARKPTVKRRERAYLNIDSRGVMIVTSIFLIGLIGVSFTQSFTALVAVSEWTGLPPALGWTVPATVDSAILIYTACALVMHARGQKNGTRYAWSMLLLFTGLSIAANVMHAVDSTAGDELRRTITGAVLAGCAPFVVFTASHMLSLVVIEPADTAIIEAPERATNAVTRQASAPVTRQATPQVTRQLGRVATDDASPGVASAANVASPVTRQLGSVTTELTRQTYDDASSDVDQQIRDLLGEGVRPTGAQIGQWLGGKSPKTGQRHLSALAERDASIASLLDALSGDTITPTPERLDRPREIWAATA